jgi:transcriptional regulator with XRE-family HTH domain
MSKGKLSIIVGRRIRDERKRRGWTQLQLGRYCGTTPQTIHRFESAQQAMELKWLSTISRVFGMTPADLVADLQEEEIAA